MPGVLGLQRTNSQCRRNEVPEQEQEPKRRRRVDMEALPPVVEPVPGTFDEVIKALVQPVKKNPPGKEQE